MKILFKTLIISVVFIPKSYAFYGHITKDTTWGDTILITGDVVVDSGVCLTIKPGTVVLFESCEWEWEDPNNWPGSEIICNGGSLEALGTPQDSIYFLEGGQWGITLRHGSAIIEYSRISGGEEINLNCRDSCVLILKNSHLGHFWRAGVWFWNNSKLVVDNCIFKPTRGSYYEQAGIRARNSDSIFISNSVIENLKGEDGEYIPEIGGCPAIGIWCEDCKYVSVLSTTISEIYGGKGVYAQNPENEIPAGNGIGILFTNTSGVVKRCKITKAIGGDGPEGRGIGIWCNGESQATIGSSLAEGNNIYDNGSYHVVNSSPYDVIATYNWWGTTNRDAIENCILHHNDNPNYGYVIYEPWAEYPLGVSERIKVKSKRIKLRIYPNPFKEKVEIRWEIDRKSYEPLKIYNISGRLIKSFTRTQSPEPKAYKVTWYGRDEKGKKLPSGVYFIKAGSKIEKVIFLEKNND